MTEQDKRILLQDLCARLPYGVMVHLIYDENTIIDREMGTGSLHDIMFDNAEGKPYLRPMSSMTEEEKEEYDKTFDWDYSIQGTPFDWLNTHHFDYRDLIEKGLALEAPEGMYKTE